MRENRWAALTLVAGLCACDAIHNTTAPRDVAGAQFAADSRVVGHAIAGGAFNIGAPGADIAVTMNALLRDDGTATGRVHYVTDLTDFGLGTIEIRFDVTCLSLDVAQGRAWIGGVVTENTSTNPTFATDPVRQVGRDVWFRVRDNASGGSGSPDVSTQLGFEGSAGIITSEEYCATRFWPADPPSPFVRGDLSVR